MTEHVPEIGEPRLNPVPSRIEELARSFVIELNTGSGSLPARLHGSGVRSLASLQLQGVLYEHRLGTDGDPPRPHPVTLMEEPEAHLHPQAVFELPNLIRLLRGQVVASTHSPYLVSVVDPRSIRILQRRGHTTNVVDIRPAPNHTEHSRVSRQRRPALYVEEMEKLKRQIERPFGELLFARGIVLGDGATERAFLPVMIRHALGLMASGISFVDPGGMSSDLAVAVVKFALLVDIPWLLFADSDKAGHDAVAKLIRLCPDQDPSHVVWVGGESGGDAEYRDKGAKATEQLLIDWDQDLCGETCHAVRPDLTKEDTGSLMRKLKGSIGSHLGYAFVKQYPDPSQWPEPLRDLIRRLKRTIQGQEGANG